MRNVPSSAAAVPVTARLRTNRRAPARHRFRPDRPLVEPRIKLHLDLSSLVLDAGTLGTTGDGSGPAIEVGHLKCLRAERDSEAHVMPDVNFRDRLVESIGGITDQDLEIRNVDPNMLARCVEAERCRNGSLFTEPLGADSITYVGIEVELVRQ